ncbi:MAG: response regulator [Bdellovibrionaceae bacterium]|nr:response regulator [Pseudobdellovibrionaceae bacterium]
MARILVVDDDPDILKMAEAVLCSAGHVVFTAEDAVRAMEWLNHIDFDLLLSDANMPIYSGFELVSTVRNNSKFKDLSIAMLTGLRERKDVERAVTAGVDDYIVKPLDPLILIQKVNSLFEKKPPLHYPEIHLAGTPLSAATMRRPVVVETVSELGVRIVTEIAMKPGMVVDITADFFTQLDVPSPPMKVLTAEIDKKTGNYRAQLIFLGANEALLQKIRRWLYSHGASAQKSA